MSQLIIQMPTIRVIDDLEDNSLRSDADRRKSVLEISSGEGRRILSIERLLENGEKSGRIDKHLPAH